MAERAAEETVEFPVIEDDMALKGRRWNDMPNIFMLSYYDVLAWNLHAIYKFVFHCDELNMLLKFL